MNTTPINLTMEDGTYVEFEFQQDTGFYFSFPEQPTFEFEVGAHVYPDYTGDYEADALFSEQVFQTKSMLMSDDFTVHAINYTEAPNDSGITVTIGG